MPAPYSLQQNDSTTYNTATEQHGPIRPRPARSGPGRPGGVSCKCKCCGKVGSYTKTCGLKHVCEIGKCAITIEYGAEAPPPPEKNTFEIACVCCQKPLRFTIKGAGSAEIVCYGCGFTMRSMASEVVGEDSGSESEAEEEVSEEESIDTVPEAARVDDHELACGQGKKVGTQCVRCQSRLEFEPPAKCSFIQCYECDYKMLYQPHSSTDISRVLGGGSNIGDVAVHKETSAPALALLALAGIEV